MRSKRGFTLIELLVVIAIIAILAAILFPVFAKARERARQAACISNQKQIVLAAKMYSDDWEGILPNIGTYSSGFFGSWTAGPDWTAVNGPIYDYVRAGQEIYQCPSVKGQGISYSWNRHVSGYPEGLVLYPSTTPLVWDGIPGQRDAPGIPLQDATGAWVFSPTGGTPNQQTIDGASRHAGGLIIAFIDGHAAFTRPSMWTSANLGGKVLRATDNAVPGVWPTGGTAAYLGQVITPYPSDPNRT
jgi:prepilin-type N-terminal cleavage/methylation domain-containing protein/prepilin-type processing-associated H-X9-DG protein